MSFDIYLDIVPNIISLVNETIVTAKSTKNLFMDYGSLYLVSQISRWYHVSFYLRETRRFVRVCTVLL